jgi:hypothetical protein
MEFEMPEGRFPTPSTGPVSIIVFLRQTYIPPFQKRA